MGFERETKFLFSSPLHFFHLPVIPLFRYSGEREDIDMELKGKRVIILGERDGVQGPAIAACVKSAGAEPLLVQTQCFV